MRYAICVNEKCEKATTLGEAVGIMASLMYIDQVEILSQVEASGMARAAYGYTTGQLSDLEWPDPSPVDPLIMVRNKVRKLYGEDGGLEVDEGAPVSEGNDGYQVQVWVWVSDPDAGIEGDLDDSDPAHKERLYIAGFAHPVAEFDDDSVASMGSDVKWTPYSRQ